MDTQSADLALFDASEGAPLIDFAQDVALNDYPDIDLDVEGDVQPPIAQEPTTPQQEYSLQTPPSPESFIYTYPGSAPYTPGRSVRQLVESLGSPVYSNPNNSPRSPRVSTPQASPPLRLPSPSPFDDPVSFEDTDSNRVSCPSPSLRTTDTASFVAFGQDDSVPRTSIDFALLDQDSEVQQPLEQDHTSLLNLPRHEFTPPPTPCPAPAQPTAPVAQPTLPLNPIVPSWLNRPSSPRPTSPIPYAISSPRFVRPNFQNPTSFSRAPARPTTNPFHAPTPAYPWNRPTDQCSRPDRFSRTTAHTTISDILFNFDIDPAAAAELIEDACETARQVGVSTYDLLSRTVFIGMSDLGMTPLCLEASRVDLESGMELVLWLIENSNPVEVEREVKKGCLMRKSGMGEQNVWNVLRGFLPDVDDKPGLAYDVEVEGLAVVRGQVQESRPVESEALIEDDDEGSLYDDVSIIDADSGFLDQADIETLKSSSDEGEEIEIEEPEPVLSRVHRARIVLPTFKEYLIERDGISLGRSTRFGPGPTGRSIKVLTAEWIFEGRLWALSIGEDSLVFTLRQTSSFVSDDPIKVKAIVRLLPLDLPWAGVREIDSIGGDRLLPTQTPSDVLFPSPLYECEFEEQEMVPGRVSLRANSSVSQTGIRVSLFTLLELVGPQNGVKIEVVVRVSEKEKEREVVASTSAMDVQCVDEPGPSGSIPDDASDWQLVDN